LRNTAHQVSNTASSELKIQTNMKGLFGPSQLTSEKLNIRMTTPVISSALIFAAMNAVMLIEDKEYSR
jgi:hypothetical protein